MASELCTRFEKNEIFLPHLQEPRPVNKIPPNTTRLGISFQWQWCMPQELAPRQLGRAHPSIPLFFLISFPGRSRCRATVFMRLFGGPGASSSKIPPLPGVSGWTCPDVFQNGFDRPLTSITKNKLSKEASPVVFELHGIQVNGSNSQ